MTLNSMTFRQLKHPIQIQEIKWQPVLIIYLSKLPQTRSRFVLIPSREPVFKIIGFNDVMQGNLLLPIWY